MNSCSSFHGYDTLHVHKLGSLYVSCVYFSSPQPLAMVRYCDRWISIVHRASCVVRRKQLLQMTSPPKLLAGFGPNWVGIIFI